jgi:hypothetical protein
MVDNPLRKPGMDRQSPTETRNWSTIPYGNPEWIDNPLWKPGFGRQSPTRMSVLFNCTVALELRLYVLVCMCTVCILDHKKAELCYLLVAPRSFVKASYYSNRMYSMEKKQDESKLIYVTTLVPAMVWIAFMPLVGSSHRSAIDELV